ncbi:hypothetical protein J8J14_10805 [Roseomonas sp. SSH11]|uniref:DUF551 domain-containing protein n=1 Tax=Pararoseomonas baculiformis TaxID=2820812 RepID=A0ABS4AE20_9PROT|nr:hypothetical protein [Pararoseomonas baculiformis]MBP0445267.1 hypothetical protein [Pararoseomonas baculiformis]
MTGSPENVWRPISRAPKDGSPVLVWCPARNLADGKVHEARAAIGRWIGSGEQGHWVLSPSAMEGEVPECWVPLPPRTRPPASAPAARNVAARKPLGRVKVLR